MPLTAADTAIVQIHSVSKEHTELGKSTPLSPTNLSQLEDRSFSGALSQQISKGHKQNNLTSGPSSGGKAFDLSSVQVQESNDGDT